MESVVENNNFRNILAEDLAAGTDALNVSGVVQGSEIAQALDAGDNILVNKNALFEQRTALDYAVADSGDVGEIVDNLAVARSKSLLDFEESCSVIFESHIVFEPSAVRGRAADSAVDTDTLADALCYKLLAVHVDELIFKR